MKKLLFLLFISLGIIAGCSEDEVDTNNNINNNNTSNNNNNHHHNNNNNNTNNNNNNFSSCPGGSMSVTFDGANSTPTIFNNTLLLVTQNGQGARRLDLRTRVASGILILSVSNWDWQSPPTDGILEKSYSTITQGAGIDCNDIGGNTYCDEGLVTFIEDGTGGTTYATLDEEYDGYVVITSIDASSKKVSGTFDARLIDVFETDTIYASGTFTNLCYTVLN